MKVIAIYPGRFQPFGMHHFKTYEWLVKKFGANNTYIVTSDKVELPKSPFNFTEKKEIMVKYGIPSSQIIKVKNPYKADELISKFSESNTAVIFAYGSKDEGRIQYTKKDGTPGYFQPFANLNTLQSYNKHGYIIIAPDIRINIPGYGNMSGTALRQAITSSTPETFKRLFGWFDKNIYNMMKLKLSKITENAPFIKKSLLIEGGAAGHMSHIIEDDEMTFGDLKEITKRSLEGKLDIEAAVTEKTDGMNLFITYKDNTIKAARNKTTLKNPLTIDELNTKFDGRGEIQKIFKTAMGDLKNGLLSIDEKTLEKIFKNGHVFINLEIIHPDNEMTINYGNTALIQLHGLIEFNEDFSQRIITKLSTSEKLLQKIIDKTNSNINNEFKIIPPTVIKVNPVPNLKNKMSIYFNAINKLQQEFGLNDNDTLYEYYYRFWRNYVERKFNILDKNIQDGLATRWIGINKSFRLDNKSGIDNNTLNKIKDFEQTNALSIQRKLVSKFETLILQISADVIQSATNFLSVNNHAEIKKIRNNLASSIKMIRSSGNLKDISFLKTQLAKIEALGGFKNITPTEGIVFIYNGKQYKMTGSFAPIHQIISLIKFRR